MRIPRLLELLDLTSKGGENLGGKVQVWIGACVRGSFFGFFSIPFERGNDGL